MPAYFNNKLLPNPKKSYVCFIDIMGIQAKMTHSINQSSNFIFKLHATILESWRKRGYSSISVYPIMDGAYITSTVKKDLLNLITDIYNSLAEMLLAETEYKHWFLVRCAISHGEIVHGREIPYNASNEFSARVGYKEQLLLGSPMIDAYQGERHASPMGIYICDSAKHCFEKEGSNWKWYNNANIKIIDDTIKRFAEHLEDYLLWLDDNADDNEYPVDSRKRHIESFLNYYEDVLLIKSN